MKELSIPADALTPAEREQQQRDTRAGGIDPATGYALVTPGPADITPRQREYVIQAMKDEARSVGRVGKNKGRNNAINKGAYIIAGYIYTGAITVEDVRGAFLQAARDNKELTEQPPGVIADTIDRAIAAGQLEPRPIPAFPAEAKPRIITKSESSGAQADESSTASGPRYADVLQQAQAADLEDVESVFTGMALLPDSFTRNAQHDVILKALAKSTGIGLTALRRDFAVAMRLDDESARAPTTAEQLLKLFFDAGNELWQDSEQEPMATLNRETHKEHHRVRSRAFRLYLQSLWHENTGGALGREPLSEALGVIEGKAIHEGETHRTFLRVAETGTGTDTRLYVDLGTDTWEAVEIMPGKWHIISSEAVPVKFLRGNGMLPLPPPKPGTLDDIAAAISIDDQESEAFQHAVAWLLQALRPNGPHPVAIVSGPQGAGKSTRTEYICGLLDPNNAPLRSIASTERDLLITTRHSWLQPKDNISTLSPAISDALCRLSTGGGFATRSLYTDDEETVLNAQRPLMLNGITNFVDRQDLVDRALSIPLRRLSSTAVKTAAELTAEYEKHRPHALGALLTIAADGLKRAGQRHLESLPRMADFAEWIAACAPALGWNMAEFLERYDGGRLDLLRESLDESPITRHLLAVIDKHNGAWEGTATELLTALNAHREEHVGKRVPKGWPQSAARLSNALRRIVHGLEMVENITAELQTTNTKKLWRLHRREKTASQSSPQPEPTPETRVGRHSGGDATSEKERHRIVTDASPDEKVTTLDEKVTHVSSPNKRVPDGTPGDRDDSDDVFPSLRGDDETKMFHDDDVEVI